jgi:hypothetical protein
MKKLIPIVILAQGLGRAQVGYTTGNRENLEFSSRAFTRTHNKNKMRTSRTEIGKD